MKTNKPIMVAGLITAVTLGSIGIATASQKGLHSVHKGASLHAAHQFANVGPVDVEASVLAQLVVSGTITQAQSTAILAALQAAQASRPQIGGGAMGEQGPDGLNLKADIAVITSTLGITDAQLQADLAAGQTLAVIAGAKTDALITALVAAQTTEINARVTSGELTQAQATTLIAGLNATVTTIVNSPLPAGGPGDDGNESDEATNGNDGNDGNAGLGLSIGGSLSAGIGSNSNGDSSNGDSQDN